MRGRGRIFVNVTAGGEHSEHGSLNLSLGVTSSSRMHQIYDPIHPPSRNEIEVSGQLHAAASLFPLRLPPFPIMKLGGPPERVATFRKRYSSVDSAEN